MQPIPFNHSSAGCYTKPTYKVGFNIYNHNQVCYITTMKRLSLKRNTIYIIGAVSLLGLSGAALAINQPEQPKAQVQEKKVVAKVEEKPEVIEQTTIEPSQVEQVQPQITNQPVQETVQPTVPVIKTTKEYAEQYLDMTVPRAYECLSAFEARWPYRFTEDVRENNIKALRHFANICTTGILDEPFKRPLIVTYGENGEWFDTEWAIAQH